ncbi:lipoprotein [Virgibacillus kekensis]|uniref:Lipoprotein n=1 Tax=Virgibacillus kekensis TaxID=202261 RepID=A0ABV9DME0_9BACI
MKKILILLLAAVVLTACSDEEETSIEQATEETEQASVKFRNVDVQVADGIATIKGEAQATDDTVYYKLEQGKTLLKKETKLKLGDKVNGWADFTVEVKVTTEMQGGKQVPVLTLYDRTPQGDIVNENYIPINLDESQKQG